jgi:hypothetical protein
MGCSALLEGAYMHIEEKKEYVLYNGRSVPKDGFRVFIYGINNTEKLVNSWDEYQKEISSGLWFSTKELAIKKPVIKVSSIENIKKDVRK